MQNLPMTGGGFEPVQRESKFVLGADGKPTTVYFVNTEVTLKRKQRAILDGRDPDEVKPVVVEVGTTVALQECRRARWELFQNGQSLGIQSIFRDATPEEIKQHLADKEKAIEARNAEVDRDAMRNAPRVIVQNIGQPLEAAGKKGK